MLELTFARQLSETERALVERGTVQIAALLAAKISGHGLTINPGDGDFAWDFILVDANDTEETTFAEKLPRMIEGYVHSAFPDAQVQLTETAPPQLDLT